MSLQAPSDQQDFVAGNFATVNCTITNQGGAIPAGVTIPYRATLTDTYAHTGIMMPRVKRYSKYR